MAKRPEVAQRRNYSVLTVEDARKITNSWLGDQELLGAIDLGLPEIDDRYHVWRVPLVSRDTSQRLGELVIDARSTLIQESKSTTPDVLERRLLHRNDNRSKRTRSRSEMVLSSLRNTIALGDTEEILQDFPAESVNLIFTSPPYFNARPEYTDYVSYEEYLLKMRKIIQQCHRVLSEGRMFVMNISPVLIRRQSRSHSSRRIAVPFDMHRLFIEEGYDFVDDIIWMKPEGAGWATGRGRRFAADRNPMQYKPVPVTEYLLVYRKHTDRLIDWHIRRHPNPDFVEKSKIEDGYERTNVWRIKPASNPAHPAVFPQGLAEKVISYYSFVDDVVLDPLAGTGTVGAAASRLGRRFVLIDIEPSYVDLMRQEAKRWLGKDAASVLCIDCPPIDTSDMMV